MGDVGGGGGAGSLQPGLLVGQVLADGLQLGADFLLLLLQLAPDGLARASAAETAWSMAACFLASPSFTMASAIFWAEWRVIRMASSVARYSSTLSTRTFILFFREVFS